MTFLNSIFLAGLAAVIIPLLIHFLSRRRIKIIDFSSLRFLLQMQKSKLRWLRILELLLLIIRMLILASIALAFARPALTGKQASSHAPASIVILIDDSPSVETLSSGGTIFDEMKRGVDVILNMLKPNDEATIITLSGRQTTIGPYSDYNRLRTQLYTLQPQASLPKFDEGLKKAAEILSVSHNLNREVYIFSDFQKGVWWDVPINLTDPQFRYFAIKYNNEDAENVSLTRTEFPPQLLAPGEEFEITAHLKNHNNNALNSRLVELFIDDEKKAQTAVNIKPSGNAAVEFTIVPESPGRHWGYFEIEDDDYNADNRFYFNLEIPPKISVLAIGQTTDDVKIISNCLKRSPDGQTTNLGSSSDVGYIDFTGIEVSGFSRQNLSAYDVVILNNITALPPSYFNSINDFVGSGGGLFIILGGSSNVESYKQFIAEKADITFSAPINAITEGQSRPYYYLDDFDLTHPIFKVYSPQNPQSSEIPSLKLFSYIPLDGGIALARLENNSAVLSLASNARIMVMGFGLSQKDSDISVHSFIVPFIIRTVEHLASAPSAAEEYFISGHPAALNIPEQLKASSVKLSKYNKSLTGAGDNHNTADEIVEVSRGAYGAFVNIPYAGFPGFYTLTTEADTVGFFSVNHDSVESTIESIDPKSLDEKLAADIIFIDGQSNIENEIMQAKFGFELWKYCLLLALALLIAESILVRKAR
ncbi:MAG: BatA domain-containing protein [candidate division Zixibacteria bacterium]|nr:BatA domain-containing protein [candidate division Zixibacteria bacterium]